MSLTPEQADFVATHRWCLLTTTASSGAPQVTMVAYAWDGEGVVMSLRRTARKWANAVARPRVAVSIVDDRRYLSLHGAAQTFETGPERDRLSRVVLDSLLPEDAALLQGEFDRGLDNVGRVVIRVVPERVLGRI